jgi:hypothetical protein
MGAVKMSRLRPIDFDLLTQLAYIDAKTLCLNRLVTQFLDENPWGRTLPACWTRKRSGSYSFGESLIVLPATFTVR